MFEKKILFVVQTILIGSVLTGISCTSKKYPDGIYAELYTNKGLIVLSLAYDKTPMTVANFVGLAEGTIKNDVFPAKVPYFNGTRFHRIVPGHVIQAGIPNTDGTAQLGYMIPNEIHPGLSHDRAGVLGMANRGPHTNGSQFYITLGDRSYLDGDYTVFGEVIAGMDVVLAIVQDDVINEVKIVRSGDTAGGFRADTESFQNLVVQVQKKVEDQEKSKKAQESAIVREKWPDAVETDTGLKYVIAKEGKGRVPDPGSKLRLRYTGEILGGIAFFSTGDGQPDEEPPAEDFVFVIGESGIHSGFDQSVARMRLGEKRIIIVPSRLGYGTGGFYAREKKGKKRFVISPKSTLVYEIEVLEVR